MTEIESWIDRQEVKDINWFIDKYKLKTKCRERELVLLRSEIFRRLKNQTLLSLTSIGRIMNRNHATVIHSISNVEYYRNHKDIHYMEMLSKYEKELNQINYQIK